MSSFTSALIVSPLPDGRNWTLVEPFEYHIGTKESADIISVPAGFVTDFASIPFIFWSVLPFWGKYGKAAIVHDYLYFTKPCSRAFADYIFLEAMRVCNCPNWQSTVMYLAVRLFGCLAWKNKGMKG
jgi:hypothetical protein